MRAPGPGGIDVDFLSLLSDVNRRRFLQNSTRAVYPAGAIVYHQKGPPVAFMCDRGLVVAYWIVPDGRKAALAFGHARELVGATNIVGQAAPVFVQVVVESTLTMLDGEIVRNLAKTEMEVLAAIATHLTARLRDAFGVIAVRSLGNIRERVAFDLLERAIQSQFAHGRFEARATHTELADSIGSSREVVSRTLKGLRAVGIIETAPGLVRVLDPIRLEAIVRAFVI
ncbi:MAG TPA: Crp/Fnr family transcriptional regulator [Candidatus Dormibacteraeota bacterium]